MSNKNKIEIKGKGNISIPCTNCFPKIYLTFNFAYIVYEKSKPKDSEIIKMWERIRWLSREPYVTMAQKYKGDKDKWFEKLPLNKIRNQIPANFREVFPEETNEYYSVMRVFPAGTPNGVANPRIIGMIKNTVFYIFYLDWDGKLYKH